MKTPTQFLLLALSAIVLLGAGYAAGHFFAEPIVEVLPTGGPSTTVTVRDGTDAVALSKALSEVAALKAELAALRKATETATPAPSQPTEAAEPRRQQRRLSWRERMEELKESDPERYKEEVARREQFTQALAQARAKRDDFLGNIDPALLTPEQRQTHERYTAALARQSEIEEQMRAFAESGEEPTEEQRETIRAVFRETAELRDAERTALLSAIGTSMGLSGEDSADFVQLVGEVYEATGGMRPPMPMGRPGGDNAPGGGRRGGRR